MADTHHKEVYVENRLEYAQFILNPKAEEEFKEITKDLATSNLEGFDLKLNELRLEIMNFLVLYPGIFTDSLNSFKRDLFSILQLHRSKRGFQSKLEKSNLSDNKSEVISHENKDKKAMYT